ncbi:MAG: hypothetical protein R3E10_12520 [Gemmatimonadota bacterium]
MNTPSSPRRSPKGLVRAVLPFAALAAVIVAWSVGLPGIATAAFGAVLVSVHLEDFVRGSAERQSGLQRPSENVVAGRRSVTLVGVPARISSGRYLLVGGLLIAGGVVETFRAGAIARLYGAGPGWPWTVMVAGALLVATAVVHVAPALPTDGDHRAVPLYGHAITWSVSALRFAFGLSLLVAGLAEWMQPGSVVELIRGLNPLRGP